MYTQFQYVKVSAVADGPRDANAVCHDQHGANESGRSMR